jgi:hypothetical protein
MRAFLVIGTVLGLAGVNHLQAGGLLKKDELAKTIKTVKESKNPKLLIPAIEALGGHGEVRASDVQEAVEPLTELLKNDSNAKVREAAALTLGKVSPDPEVAVPALVAALKDKVQQVPLAACNALARIGPEAKEALPALLELMKESKEKANKKLLQAANLAIKSIRGGKKN